MFKTGKLGSHLCVVFTVLGIVLPATTTFGQKKGNPPPPVVVPTVPAPPAVSVQVLGVTNSVIVVSENPINYGFEVTARYISGPLPPPPAFGVSWYVSLPGSSVTIHGLLPNSDYVFELVRVSRNLQRVTSAGTRFSFRTPPDPRTLTLTAPQNVRSRLAASPDTTLISWDTVPGAATYEFTLDGVNFTRICFNAAYCPPEGEVSPIFSFATATLPGKQFRVRAVGFVTVGGGARPLGPLSAPLSF